MKDRKTIFINLCVSLSFAGCLDPYQPPTVQQNINALVVDGFLDVTNGQVNVRLSHTHELSDEGGVSPEADAFVSVRTESGQEFELTEVESGKYSAGGLSVDPNSRYLLFVQTADGQSYISDYVETNSSTPPIDSITWNAEENGVNIQVNSHDENRNSRYYSWTYEETWEYHAPVSSDFKLVNKSPVYRLDSERIYTCWSTAPSTKISVATTVRLTEDVVDHYTLVFLPAGSRKISTKYSILVKQRAISKKEFEFLEQLQKTTESIGGLFDPQPSQVSGNIRNLTDPASVVLGYFSAGAVREKRFFLGYNQLPSHLKNSIRPVACQPDTICAVLSIPRPFQCTLDLPMLSGTEIIGTSLLENNVVVGYTWSNPTCADCRTEGGVLTKPAFWP